MTDDKRTVRERVEDVYEQTVFSRSELVESGMSSRDITSAVNAGTLWRLRRDHYAVAGIDADVAEAVRVGGRVSCISLLQKIGVFVLRCAVLHIHARPGSSRLRKPHNTTTVLHWDVWSGHEGPRHAVSLLDAIRHSMRCQEPRAAIATLDSLLHHRLVTRQQIESVIAVMPARFAVLLALTDPSAESGSETFMRLMLRALGVRYETQVTIPGVGRVDFVVDGWLIIECDSKEFHQGWDQQTEDRVRDIAAARLGYVTIRPIAADILYHSARVQAAVADVIRILGPRFTGAWYA